MQEEVISRIRHLINISRVSQAEFARRIGLDPSNMSKHLSGRLPVTEGLVNRIVADMGVSKRWLRYGDGVPFPKERRAPTLDASARLLDPDEHPVPDAIPVYDIDVTAGSMPLERMFTEENIIGTVSLPALRPDDVVVRVWGDSMMPRIRDGAYLAIHRLTNPSLILWGEIYIVVLDDYRMVKHLHRHPTDAAKVILRSENPAYEDIEVERADIRALFIVNAIINLELRG